MTLSAGDFWTTQRVLISGITGFLGRKVHSSLLAYGAEVGAVLRPESQPPNLPCEPIRWSGDIQASVEQAVRFDPTVVIHLAARGGSGHLTSDLPGLIDANLTLEVVLLEVAHRQSHRIGSKLPFVLIGSYFQNSKPACGFAPNSLYASMKQAQFDMAEYYASIDSIAVMQLRPFDIYGPNDNRGRFLNLVASAVRSDEPLAATAGEQLVSFVHLDDVVSAIEQSVRALATDDALGKAYVVRSDEIAPLRDTVEHLLTEIGAVADIRWGEKPYGKGVVMEPWPGVALPSWHPQIDLATGFSQLLEENYA